MSLPAVDELPEYSDVKDADPPSFPPPPVPFINTMVPPEVEVVSWNVLSMPLCCSDWFPKCERAALKKMGRFNLIQTMLQEHVINRAAIVCLQEVDQTTADEALAPFFDQRDYTFVHRVYGNMGVAVAFPNAKYVMADVDTHQPFKDHKYFPRPEEPGITDWVLSCIGTDAMETSYKHQLRQVESYDISVSRENLLLMVGLRSICTDTPGMSYSQHFTVVTGHMPCKFWLFHLMTFFFAEFLDFAHRFNGDNVIFAGDFNLKANSPQLLKLKDGGDLRHLRDEEGDGLTASAFFNDKHTLSPAHMRFDNANKHPIDTDWSCWSGGRKEGDPEFKEQLDHMFVDDTFEVVSFETLCRDVTTPIPSMEFPSDHLPIRGRFKFVDPTVGQVPVRDSMW